MTTLPTRRTIAISGLLTLSIATACQDAFESPVEPQLGVVHGNDGQPKAFEVYNQNLYLGGDTGPLFTIDFSNIPALIGATNTFWGDVQASDIPSRAKEFVNEIDERRPHVVSLQEVLRFVLLDSNLEITSELDFLEEIEKEIALRNLPYKTEVVQNATSSRLPLGFDPSVGVTQWLSFTDRVVILRRSDVDVVDSAQGLYNAFVPLGALDLVRGWARITVNHNGTPHHFLATHLETQGIPGVNLAQGIELETQVLAGLEGVTIISGDLNSDAAAIEGAVSWTPTYSNLMAAGFTDVWDVAPARRGELGVTCCQDPSLQNESELDQRIDFVLVRSTETAAEELRTQRGLFRAEILGDGSSDRTEAGLWPSDHAGIAAMLRIPGGARPFSVESLQGRGHVPEIT